MMDMLIRQESVLNAKHLDVIRNQNFDRQRIIALNVQAMKIVLSGIMLQMLQNVRKK